jgi:aspartate/glutamate racemase
MAKRLVMIHTVAPLVEVFTRLAKELLPDVQTFHVLDEPLLEQARQHSSLRFGVGSDRVDGISRLNEHISAALDIGADAVLVTCSTVSPYLDEIPKPIPILKIDEAMIENAVAQGQRIAVLATNPKTLEPTRAALEAQAAAAGKNVAVRMVLVEGAFSAFLSGSMTEHDRLVKAAVQAESADADLIVLAQASMARVLDTIPVEERLLPVLTSPHTALERVRAVLQAGQG